MRICGFVMHGGVKFSRADLDAHVKEATCDDVAKFTYFADAFHPALRFTSNVSQHSVSDISLRVLHAPRMT